MNPQTVEKKLLQLAKKESGIACLVRRCRFQYFRFNSRYAYQCCREEAIELFRQWLAEHGIDPNFIKIVATKKIEDKHEPIFYYKFIFRVKTPEELKIFSDRPTCPECGSKHVISRGKEWYCRQCGRYWSKIRRRKPQPLNISK